MAGTGPRVAETPLELLNNRVATETPLLNEYGLPPVFGVLGFGSILIVNWATRRPVLSGIHKHFIAFAVCAGVGHYFNERHRVSLAHRDAILRHYVELHPEDFPAYERKKYKDVLEKWIPIR